LDMARLCRRVPRQPRLGPGTGLAQGLAAHTPVPKPYWERLPRRGLQRVQTAVPLPYGPSDPCPLRCPPLFGRAEEMDKAVAPLPTQGEVFLLARGEHRIIPPVTPEPEPAFGAVLKPVVRKGTVPDTPSFRALQALMATKPGTPPPSPHLRVHDC